MKKMRKLLFVVIILGIGVIVLSNYSTTTRQGTVPFLSIKGTTLQSMVRAYKEDSCEYPRSLEDVMEQGDFDDKSFFAYPALISFPADRRDIPPEKMSLQWIYLPPKPGATGNVPLFIAPLPFECTKGRNTLKRIVVYAEGAVQFVPEEEIGAIWM